MRVIATVSALTVGLLAVPLPSRAESLRGLSAERRLRVTFTEQNPGPSTPSATDPLCAYMDLSVQNAQIYVELLDCTQRSTFNWAGSDLPTDAQRKQLCGCTALIKKLKSLKLPRCTAILSGKSMTYKGVMEYAFAYCDDPGTPSQSSTVTDNSDNQSTFSPSYSNNDNSNSNANSNRWTSSSEDEDKKSGMSTATIGAIIGAAVVVIVLIGFTTYRCGKKRREGATTTGPASVRSPSINDDVSGNYSTVTASTTTKNVNTKQTRTTTSTGTGSSNGDRMNRAESTLWDDPVIVAMRIPIDAVTFGPVISRGGYGEVYRGEYRGETVAIKRLLPERRKDLRQIQAFLGEVKMMAGMEHDRIVRFVGVAWSSLSDLCVVSEFMERGDLRSVLNDFEDNQHRPHGFDADKVKIALHVAHALTYLHSLQPVIVHRDLKSKNILLTSDYDAKVTDFGVSRERADSTMTAGVGSSLWMAPEVMLGERYDERADVFSFGVVLSELDTHMLPYAQAKETGTNRKLPETAVLQMVSLGRLSVSFSSDADPELVALGRECVRVNARERPSSSEVLHRVHQLWRAYR
ncbi:hypothetical protein ATCC90586_008200 [Pythium insidiosum]|nr:hypothetical protein ATCC90586_008200 [Pythium insidiosum]